MRLKEFFLFIFLLLYGLSLRAQTYLGQNKDFLCEKYHTQVKYSQTDEEYVIVYVEHGSIICYFNNEGICVRSKLKAEYGFIKQQASNLEAKYGHPLNGILQYQDQVHHRTIYVAEEPSLNGYAYLIYSYHRPN